MDPRLCMVTNRWRRTAVQQRVANTRAASDVEVEEIRTITAEQQMNKNLSRSTACQNLGQDRRYLHGVEKVHYLTFKIPAALYIQQK